MHHFQDNKLPKLFQDLFCKTGTVHGHDTRHTSKNSYFRQEWKNILLKIYWSLKGHNSGQTLTMFIKNKGFSTATFYKHYKKFLISVY